MKSRHVTFNEADFAIEFVGGKACIQALMAIKGHEQVKYGDDDIGRYEALRNRLGDPLTEKLLADQVRIVLADEQTAVVEKRILSVFDRISRRIWTPPSESQITVAEANRSFYLEPPTILYAECHNRLAEFFPKGAKFASVSEFGEKIEALGAQIRGDELVRNILNGPYFPICLPQIEAGDVGEILEGFVEAAGRSYEHHLGRKFTNHRKGTLAGQVTIMHDSHKRVVEKMIKGPLVGLLTVPLQGFSIPAQREQMAGLPEFMSLAGLEFAVAMIAYPETLARDWHTPGLDLSAYQWQSAGCSLSFEADGVRLGFDDRYLDAGGYYSGGLFLLG